MNRKNRNGIIELWRFIAAMSIAIYHFEWLYNGTPIWCTHFYIFVEFFFVLSGFFIVINIKKNNNEMSSWEYVWRQTKKLYPVYLGGFFVSFVVVSIVEQTPIGEWGYRLWKAKWEILLLSTAGFDNAGKTYNLGGAPQYITSLLFGTLILHFLIKKYKDLFKNLIGPILIIGGYAKLINDYGNLSQWMAFDGIFNTGIIRGITDMSVGAMAALLLVPQLEKFKENSSVKIFWGGIVLSLGQLLALILGDEFISFNDLILWVFIYAVIISAFYISGNVVFDRANFLFICVGEISYSIFVFHYPIILLFANWRPAWNYYVILLVYLIVLFVVGQFILKIREYLQRKRV